MEVRALGPADLPRFAAAADAVFVTARGRSGSIIGRWPGLFTDASIEAGDLSLFGIEVDGTLASGLAVRRLSWDGSERRGQAIGFVFTTPDQRRRGLGRQLVETVAGRIKGPLVLWTGRPAFYQSLGWEGGEDGGLLGQAGPAALQPLTATAAVATIDPARLERIRRSTPGPHCRRRPADWLARPLAAQTMRVALGEAAYALFGRTKDEAILYEMTGDPAEFAHLWPSVAAGVARVVINGRRDDPATLWLSETHHVAFAPRPLTLWHGWPAADRPPIPWIDRI
jgi:GNAT superfamily N-acetyltransferase